MPSFNRVVLLGNLTRDPELRYTPSGTAVTDIGLAINRKFKDKDETTFVDVTLWGRVAEVAEEYCKKGDPLLVEGRLQTESWEDKQTGQRRWKLKVTGENIQLLGKGRSSDDQQPKAPREVASQPDTSWLEDEEVPF